MSPGTILSAYLFTEPASNYAGHPVRDHKRKDNQLKAHRDKISESQEGRGTETHYRQGDGT